jgi:predicted TIM-barrel fold metal-dependent hydrolase
LAGSYEQVKRIVEDYVDRNAPDAKDKIFGENASRFYDLKAHTNGFAN